MDTLAHTMAQPLDKKTSPTLLMNNNKHNYLGKHKKLIKSYETQSTQKIKIKGKKDEHPR
jgi:hypothetical protein